MRAAAARPLPLAGVGPDPDTILGLLPFPVALVDGENRLLYLNGAGEEF